MRIRRLPADERQRYLWGDDESHHVIDWYYLASSELLVSLHVLPPGVRYAHSETHKSFYHADECYYLLRGELTFHDPERRGPHGPHGRGAPLPGRDLALRLQLRRRDGRDPRRVRAAPGRHHRRGGHLETREAARGHHGRPVRPARRASVERGGCTGQRADPGPAPGRLAGADVAPVQPVRSSFSPRRRS